MTPTSQQSKKSILLIEDDPTYRTVIMTTLRKAGMNCTFCVDGDHAIKRLSQEKFDLMIVDYLLPGPNALEIIQWAREKGIKTPALIVTNYPSEELSVSQSVLGNTKVLPKSGFNPSNMPAIIQEMINSKP